MSEPGTTGDAGGDSDAPTPPTGPPPSLSEILGGELGPGTMVGDFRIESRLGAGGMATVYAAIEPLIGKRAAIKVLSRPLCLDPPSVARFVQEARAVNKIGHPNIVDAFAFGTLPDGRSYMVMELLPGETLAARLRRGPLGIGEALAIIFQICDGLAAAHDKGIVHRDLKPENVFLVPVRNRRLLVKLLDFGIAKLRGPQHEPGVSFTQPGKTIGTPRYMAPEQARGKEVDYRADVYALGVTAYEMLTGRPPFLGDEAIDVMHQHVYNLPPAPSLLRPDLPLQIERLLLQMLEKRPEKRPTLMQIEARLADVRDALRVTGPAHAISGEVPADAREPTPNKHIVAPRVVSATDSVATVAPSRSRVGQVVAAGVVVTVALGLTVAFKLVAHRPPVAAAPPAATVATAMAQEKPVVEARRVPPALAAEPVRATLELTVNVPNAAVSLDGDVLAESTPGGRFTVDNPGVHELVVSAPKRRSVARTITLAPGGELQVNVRLEPLAATARATPARPTPARVTPARPTPARVTPARPTPAPASAAARPTPAPSPPPARPHSRDDMIDPFATR
jgi:serine/threonine-protein kinase